MCCFGPQAFPTDTRGLEHHIEWALRDPSLELLVQGDSTSTLAAQMSPYRTSGPSVQSDNQIQNSKPYNMGLCLCVPRHRPDLKVAIKGLEAHLSPKLWRKVGMTIYLCKPHLLCPWVHSFESTYWLVKASCSQWWDPAHIHHRKPRVGIWRRACEGTPDLTTAEAEASEKSSSDNSGNSDAKQKTR